eukprot:Seg1774.4 transcript_id=Seg1774.4/GoldUCD/mRNA.D3Y31 product="hypothetical protein" protein_id=Seg1774.4/GoldUCD/D3Y31
MALRKADLLLIAAIFFLSFSIKRWYFISSDAIGLSVIGEEVDLNEESFIMTSLWANNRGPLNLNDFAKLRGTKILHGNVRNLQSNFVHISSLLGIYPDIDILGLTETHITGDPENESAQALLQIPGFTFLNRNRPTGKGGGVGTYLSNKMCFDRRNDLEYADIECIWIEVTCRFAKNFLVCCMFRPPSSSHYLPNNFNDRMRDMLSTATVENKEVIVLGDVNVNYLVKEDNKDFKEILALLGLKQLIKDATRICETTKTLIDIIATTNCKNIRSANVFPSGLVIMILLAVFAK